MGCGIREGTETDRKEGGRWVVLDIGLADPTRPLVGATERTAAAS
jgi:hypothetical protein